MSDKFTKLMRKQLQEKLNKFSGLVDIPVPKDGWIRIIRDALGVSSVVLARKLGCSRVNVTALERRERSGTISLEALEQVARALDCKLVYCLVPNEPLDKILEKQARVVAKRRVEIINHSMALEQQGLTAKQLQQQEQDLVEELLQGNLKNLWSDDEV